MDCIFPLLIPLVFTGATLSSDSNLIHNGDFSDSTTTPWTLDANGSSAAASTDSGCYIIDITSPGNNETAPQLTYRGLNLETNEGYTLSFSARASDTGRIRVFVAGKDNTVYTDSAHGIFPISAAATTRSVDFVVRQANSNARLVFNCGFSPNPIRITFDDISLTKKTVPMIQLTAPLKNDRWISNTERRIEWYNSGTLHQVRLSVSVDSGSSWQIISAAATNQQSFWWKIPASTAGNYCRIMVSDSSGTIADTSDFFRIVAAESVDPREMVKNGGFLDTTDWRFSTNSPAKASGAFDNDHYVIKIKTVGELAWQVKLEQPGFTLENGTMYRFSFDAYASHKRSIYANVGADNGNPVWSVFGGDTIPVYLSTEKARYFQTIIMKYPTANNIRVEFNCGNDTGTVHIDNVSLIPLEADDVMIFNPSPGSILKSGSTYTIEWHAASVATVYLEFSSDSGTTWTSISGDIDNNGTSLWTVPDLSSTHCFIRIGDATGDTAIGTSALFQINKFGAPVKTGELIANGSFTGSMENWNITFDGAQGTTTTAEQMFRLSVDQPGESPGTITLSQSNLPILSGERYTLSFDAFANGTRSLRLLLLHEDDSLRLLDTTVDLPAVKARRSFSFSSGSDAVTRLEFHLGGSRADVVIDNVSLFTGPDPNTIGVIATPVKAVLRPFTIRHHPQGILFIAPETGARRIMVYNLKGILVHTVPINGSAFWNGRSGNDTPVARGSYVAILSGTGRHRIQRFVIR